MSAVRNIIERCGGVSRISEATGQSESAVYKWVENGVPEKHWATLRDLAPGLTVDEMHSVNEAIRQSKAAADHQPEAA